MELYLIVSKISQQSEYKHVRVYEFISFLWWTDSILRIVYHVKLFPFWLTVKSSEENCLNRGNELLSTRYVVFT